MNITDKERIEFLETLAREQYTQGDNYYAYKGKQDLWHFGYDNDYPLQHGKGEKSTIHSRIVNTLITRRDKVENLLISGVSNTFVCQECGNNKKAIDTTLGKFRCSICRSTAN
jgi:hypothetical protein